MAQTTFDIELALLRPDAIWQEVIDRLGNTCELENRSDQGWGLVVRVANLPSAPLGVQLSHFLAALAMHEALLRSGQPVLRIAAFNPNVTCTVLLEDLDRICALGAKVELSVYPVDD
jgi:hypothetical protein